MSKKTSLLLSVCLALLSCSFNALGQEPVPPAPPAADVAPPAAPAADIQPPARADIAPPAPVAKLRTPVAIARAPVAPRAATPPATPRVATPPAAPRAPATPALAQDVTLFAMQDNFLGVHVEEVTRETMGRFSLREPRGVAVTRVVKDSPAERAGLRENDVIIRFDGETVTGLRKLNRLIDESAPEHTARLTISRGGAEQEISVKLGQRKDASGFFRGEVLTPEQSEDLLRRGKRLEDLDEGTRKRLEELRRNSDGLFSMNFGAGRRIGVSTTRLTEQLADYFGVERGRGVLVTSVTPDSPAARAGLKAGDVITEADGERVAQATDLSRVINRKKEGEVTLTVVHEKKTRTVRLMPERAAPQHFEFNLTDFDAPTIALTLPSIKLPSITLPNITLPRIHLAPVVLPRIRVTTPRINIPRIRLRPLTVLGDPVLM
ncbi:MAG TPA: PDZ domain-containing protein [Pyrinomonadaceae bacterium]|nr:PDZ domain-containing protein [Pyrinomonadaceae bacterium]